MPPLTLKHSELCASFLALRALSSRPSKGPTKDALYFHPSKPEALADDSSSRGATPAAPPPPPPPAGDSSSRGATPAAPPPPPPPAGERAEDPATHARLLALLSSHGLAFSTLAHAPTRTSEESAAVRGAPLASGAKAMLLKASKPLPHGSPYLLAVLSAARKADLRSLRGALAQKSVSLAPVEDVWRLTGCVPGAVPPFGSLFPGVKTYCDPSLVAQGEVINFNAALRGSSVIGLRTADFLRVEQPVMLAFSEPM